MTSTIVAPEVAITADLTARVDALFDKADHDDTPGVALAVVRNGDVVLQRFYGRADLEHNVPIGPDTMFDIASTSKQFTAAALVLLANRGAISLDDEVQSYIPELPDFDRPVTLRHLIHHTSGLRDYLGVQILLGTYGREVVNTIDILELTARQTTLNFAPGERHLYCNTGYVLMGIVVARVTGMSFPEFVRAEILEPLGMTKSFFRDDPTRIVPGLARGYTFRDGQYHKAVEGLDDVAGDGGLIANVLELAKWDRNYIDESVGGPGFTHQMETVGTPEGSEENYAFGLSIGEHNGLRTVSHGGALSGFQGEFLRLPDQGLTVIVQANTGGFDSSGIARKVADIFLGATPAEEAEVVDSDGARDEGQTGDSDLAGMYIHEESGNAFDLAVENEQLVLAVQDIRIPMRRRHGDRFITEHPVYSLDMRFDTSGTEPALQVYMGDEVAMTLQRVQPPDPSTMDLSALAGRYHSRELDAVYDIRAEDGELHIWRKASGRDKLRPVKPDQFAAPFGRIRFESDDSGRVTSLVADASRATGVRFSRAR